MYIYICIYILYPFIRLANIYRASLYTRHCPRCWGYSHDRLHGACVQGGEQSPSPQPYILCC